MAEGKLGAQIASHTPGRLRIRFDRPHRHGPALQRVVEHMQDQPGVGHVETNPVTGSLVVHYDRHGARREMLLGALSDMGVILRDLTEKVGGEELPAEGPGRSTAAISVVDSMSDLDRRLSELTGRKIDLKLLFPLSLGVIGLRQVITRGWGLNEVPAYVLLWYAFDSFWKFHREPPGPVATGINGHDAALGPPAISGRVR